MSVLRAGLGLLSRVAGLAITLLAVSGAIFLLLDVLPGDPASIMLGTSARPDTLAALRVQLGLDGPPLGRYLAWLAGMARGDFGQSITYAMPVGPLLLQRLAVTLPLAGLALAVALAVAIPLGTVAAARRGRGLDRIVSVLSQIGLAVPNFWLGLLLVLAFATGLGWFPAGGFPGWAAGPAALGYLVLPALALGLPQAAVLLRVTRGAVLEVAGAEFVRTARAKGLGRPATLWRHVLPNALVPVTTLIGLQLSFLVAGAVLVETVFNLPGLGRLAVQALATRDLAVIRSVVFVLAAGVIAVNAAIDVLQRAIDPRLAAP